MENERDAGIRASLNMDILRVDRAMIYKAAGEKSVRDRDKSKKEREKEERNNASYA